MDSRTKKILWFGVSTAIILALIYIVDFNKFIQEISSAKLIYFIPAVILGISVFLVWGFTWYRVFRKVGIDLTYSKSLEIFMAGTFMNSITPIGQFGGEPIMAYLLKNNSDASYEKSFTSVFSADIINAAPLITFVTAGTLYLLFFETLGGRVLQAVYAAILMTVFGGAIVYLLWFESGTIENFLLRVAEGFSEKTGLLKGRIEGFEKRLEEVERAFETIGEDPWYLFETALVSHLGFVIQGGTLYLVMLSLGVEVALAPIVFVVVISGLANFSPTPGGSGAYEVVMAKTAQAFFSIEPEVGVAAAILFRLTTYWPGIIIGYIALNTLENGDSV